MEKRRSAVLFLERNTKKQRNTIQKGVKWALVKKVEHLGREDDYVYDLSIDEHERFACSGIFVHNSDYETETLQSLAGTVPISPELIKRGPEIYEAVKYAEVLKLYEGAQRDLATLNEVIGDMGDKAARMAARLFEEAAEAGRVKRAPGIFSGFMRWCKRNWKVLAIFGIILCIVMVILYGGYLIT